MAAGTGPGAFTVEFAGPPLLQAFAETLPPPDFHSVLQRQIRLAVTGDEPMNLVRYSASSIIFRFRRLSLFPLFPMIFRFSFHFYFHVS